MADFLIIGGHGKVALRTAPLLVEEGHRVTSLIRNPDQSAEIEALGATPLVLDIQTATQNDLADAMRGKDGVIWTAGAGGGDPERTWAVDRDAAIRSMTAAEQAGVERYVMVSYLGASLEHGQSEDEDFYPYAQSKAEADDHLRSTPLKWTLLGPGHLTLEEPTGSIAVGTQPESREVSRGNVARVIAATVSDDSTIGKAIPFVDGQTPIREAVAQAPATDSLA